MKHLHITRREMMANTARAVAGLTLTASCAPLAERPSAETCDRGFKLGVCDWTIGKKTDPAALEMAKRIGLDGVQVDFGRGENDLPLCNPQLQKTYLAEAKKHDMEIASLALGVLNNVPYKSARAPSGGLPRVSTSARQWVSALFSLRSSAKPTCETTTMALTSLSSGSGR